MSALVFALMVSAIPLPAPGSTLDSVRQDWADGRTVTIEQAQGFTAGLIDTGLLGELNRYRWSPRISKGRFVPSLVDRFWVGPSYVIAFDKRDRIRYALFRFSVPVDASNDQVSEWSPNRLHRFKRVSAQLRTQLGLVPERRDRWGNIFAWRRQTPRPQARLRYEPLSDELLLLLRY
ncbi:MAG: hypothetical protein AAFN74_05865 [Myxococcota bacterium]